MNDLKSLSKRLRQCEAALLNMHGHFSTPVARLKIPGDEMTEEARESARAYLADNGLI